MLSTRVGRSSLWTVVAVLLLAACTTRSGESSSSPSPSVSLQATDTGVTPTELHIGVVADVNVAVRPGLFQPAVDGVRAWAEHVNAGGGLAGRKVVVDFYDSRLTADGWHNAVRQACQNDLAMVATSAIADSNVADLTGCGIPDFANLTPTDEHATAPNTFSLLSQQPHRQILGPERWYLAEFKDKRCCDGVWLDNAATPSALAQAQGFRKGQLQIGFTEARSFSIIGLESDYAPFALAIKNSGATYVRVGTDYNQTVALRREAKVQGVDSVVVWDCSLQCYTPDFLRTGGADVEGQYVYNYFEPFEEADQYPGLQTFISSLKKFNPKAPVNGFSQGAWISGLLFGEAVEQTVAVKGPDGLTRANLLESIRGIHDFDADGMTGPVDIGNKAEVSCYMVMQVRDGKFVRVHPDKGLNCDPANVVTVE
ncbi:ABC transporter substrate-binding protein [Kitasatospora sp. NBC_00240]|uniref:ABC transporter substrate-binding protein n=1 Tax=Kitasatospora sp. NBC_00240 TaxID=2903567 RepID=UPI00225B2BA4|nr:ABC transporter substrate-binding protein [Kitasatospora sp. NBC_00240]MCX5215440.1 ABC transporter substrate-binding protein [Kitasatospora sp. NBC_00240]